MKKSIVSKAMIFLLAHFFLLQQAGNLYAGVTQPAAQPPKTAAPVKPLSTAPTSAKAAGQSAPANSLGGSTLSAASAPKPKTAKASSAKPSAKAVRPYSDPPEAKDPKPAGYNLIKKLDYPTGSFYRGYLRESKVGKVVLAVSEITIQVVRDASRRVKDVELTSSSNSVKRTTYRNDFWEFQYDPNGDIFKTHTWREYSNNKLVSQGSQKTKM